MSAPASPVLHARPALAPRVRLQVDPVSGARVLLYAEGIVELNETAGEIVAHCDGATSTAALVEKLAAEYGAAPHVIEGDVLACLQDLQSRQLIVFHAP